MGAAGWGPGGTGAGIDPSPRAIGGAPHLGQLGAPADNKVPHFVQYIIPPPVFSSSMGIFIFIICAFSRYVIHTELVEFWASRDRMS